MPPTKSAPKTTTKTSPKPAAKSASKPVDKAPSAPEAASPEQEMLLQVMSVAELIDNRLGRLLRESDLSTSQYHALRALRDSGESMPSLEVAARMPQVAPAITRIVEQLSGRGLVERQQSSEDGRVFLISLTAEGKRLMKKLDAPVQKLHSTILENVPRAELKKLTQAIESMKNGLAD